MSIESLIYNKQTYKSFSQIKSREMKKKKLNKFKLIKMQQEHPLIKKN